MIDTTGRLDMPHDCERHSAMDKEVWAALLQHVHEARMGLTVAQADFDKELARHRAELELEHAKLVGALTAYQEAVGDASGVLQYRLVEARNYRHLRHGTDDATPWPILTDSWIASLRTVADKLDEVLTYSEPPLDLPEHRCEVPSYKPMEDMVRSVADLAGDCVAASGSLEDVQPDAMRHEVESLREHYAAVLRLDLQVAMAAATGKEQEAAHHVASELFPYEYKKGELELTEEDVEAIGGDLERSHSSTRERRVDNAELAAEFHRLGKVTPPARGTTPTLRETARLEREIKREVDLDLAICELSPECVAADQGDGVKG